MSAPDRVRQADSVAAAEADEPWEQAWSAALYGPAGFYRRPEGPAGHFRTASHAAPDLLAGALARLARLGGCIGVVDIGAGRGELLGALVRLADAGQPDAAGLALHGCDIVDRPAGLPATVTWSAGLDAVPDAPLDGALVVGWELLDVVPCPVVEVDAAGAARVVLVEPGSGRERPGPPVTAADADWLHRWWSLDGAPAGTRAEVGRQRDALWSGLATRCRQTPNGAVLLAVDYAHTASTRPVAGSLTGFRAGRLVPPVPDGSCDLTAHVALDAVAAAACRAGASPGELLGQREALRALGLGAGAALAAAGAGAAGDGAAGAVVRAAGAAGLLALARRSAAAELLDPDGLGGFSWLLQAVGRPQPVLARV